MSTRPDAIIWVADGEATPELDYGRRLEEQLALHGRSAVRASLEDPDPTLVDAAPLHILTGGATSVNASDGWMPQALTHTKRLVERARERRHGLLGVCLGAQMIAASAWDRAVCGGDRIEVGLTPIDWNAVGRGRPVVASFHYEKVRAEAVLNGGGRIVGANELTEVQAFRLGPCILGVQFHPELSPEDMRALTLHHRATIEQYGGDVRAALASIDELEAEWSADLLVGLVESVSP